MIGRGASFAPLARALNRGGRVIERAGLPVVRLDAEQLAADARRRVRLEDFGDETFREPLRRLVASLEQEAGLNLLGRLAAKQDLTRLLTNRLRIVRDQKAHPEIVTRPIVQPIFVTGLPRTGTTLLQGLLAQDPESRAALNWETMMPSPPPEHSGWQAERHIAQAERLVRWANRLNPNIRRLHPFGARLPEECLIITSHSLYSFQFQTMYHVPSYETWLEAQDLRTCYAWHRRMLLQLQWRVPGSWVLKAPAHLFGIEAIFATYPDAGIVFTHRDPLPVAASLASLTTVLRSTFSDETDPRAVGPEMTARWADALYGALRARDAIPARASRFYDVRYDDLLRDPIGTVRAIYRHYGRALTPAAESAMRQYLHENPKDKHGRHEYSLEQFGLDTERERARYAAYRERFGV
jgi:hypothetical protein